jgi:probable F420-dependent oxidoreductase
MRSYLDELDGASQPVPREERVIGALRQRALQLAKSRTAGAHPYNVTPEHTARTRALLGPEALLIPEQKVLICSDVSAARRIGRRRMAMYLDLPNYLNNWRELGFDDTDFSSGGSDRLIDAMVAWGSATAVARRIRDHLDAGADQVAVQVLNPSGDEDLPLAQWSQAAGALQEVA